jgi:hypothetical protein
VQHIALEDILPPGYRVNWLNLRPACAELKTLTLVEHSEDKAKFFTLNPNKEWQLVKIPSGLDGPAKVPETFWADYDFVLKKEGIPEYGNLAWSLVDAKYSRKQFLAELRNWPEWEGVAFEFAVLASRDI